VEPRLQKRCTLLVQQHIHGAGKSAVIRVIRGGLVNYRLWRDGMRCCSRGLLLLSLLIAAPNARADDAKPTEAPSSFDLPAIDAYVASQVRAKGYPGLALSILRDGKVVFAKGYGRRSLMSEDRVMPDTPFAIGSVTKQFTCACILMLAEDGKLSVEDRVAKYYPDLTRAQDITLYDLMT